MARGKLLNPDDVGYDVIVLAGQSNMSGRGQPFNSTNLDPIDARIWQYGNSGGYPNQISLAVEPLLMHDAPYGIGPGLQFARWYAGTVPDNRRVLLVPVAHGATGFRTTDVATPPTGWGGAPGGTWAQVADAPVGSTNLFENAVTQALGALAAAGPNSRLIAVLWHQGEADNPYLNQTTYAAALDQLIAAFRTRLAAPTLPFVLGAMNPDWVALGTGNAVAINAAHVDTPYRTTRTAFALPPAGHSYDLNSTVIHYDGARQRLLGRNYFDALALARANVTGAAPLSPGPVTVTQSGGSTATVTWVRPVCRVTDYLVEYRIGTGAWSTLTRARSIDTSATVSGVSAGQTVTARVSTVNEQGTSTPTVSAGLRLVFPPNSVTGLTVGTPTASTLPVSWTAPAVDSTHDAATSYLVEVEAHSGGTYTAFTTVTGTSATVLGLSPNKQYDVRVTPSNANASATPSVVTATTANLTPLLDDVGLAAYRAYSTRLLRAAWAGKAIRVRRSSDNTEADIGFVNGDLDTATLLTFAGAGSAYVKVWYDQSGGGRDVSTTTTTQQPRIVNSGVLDVANGKAALVFDGVANILIDAVNVGLYAAGAATQFAVYKGTMSGASIGVIAGESSTANTIARYFIQYVNTGVAGLEQWIIRNDGNVVLSNNGAGPIGNSVLNVGMIVDSGSVLEPRVNGTSYTTVPYTRSGTMTTLNRYSVGGAFSGGTATYFLAGQLSDVVAWTAALTPTQKAVAEANCKAYWGTP